VARLIDRETARVRVVGDLRPGQRIDLLEILNALVGSCKALYRDKALNFVVQVPQGATLLGDREDLFELFGNLIDNASKWANTQVFISLQGTTVEISDDGPGCPPACWPKSRSAVFVQMKTHRAVVWVWRLHKTLQVPMAQRSNLPTTRPGLWCVSPSSRAL